MCEIEREIIEENLGFKETIKMVLFKRSCEKLFVKEINGVRWSAYTDYKLHPKAKAVTDSAIYADNQELCREIADIINRVKFFLSDKNKKINMEFTNADNGNTIIKCWVAEDSKGNKVITHSEEICKRPEQLTEVEINSITTDIHNKIRETVFPQLLDYLKVNHFVLY